MFSVTRTRGVAGPSEVVVPVARAVLGGYATAEAMFADQPAITCEVWPGGGLPVAATLPVAWLVDPAGNVVVDFIESTMASLATGWYGVRVRLQSNGMEILRFNLRVDPGVGSSELRPSYHTYEDLLAEYPYIEKFASKLHDQSGFAVASARASDWVDERITAYARNHSHGCRTHAVTYSQAIADRLLVVDTPEGRRLVEASVYRALSIILRRAEGVASNADDVVGRQQYYEQLAWDTLDGAVACFDPSTGLPSVTIGGMPIGRITR